MQELGQQFKSVILQATGAKRLRVLEVIQELWSGYGQILRIALDDPADGETIVVKHVRLPTEERHPRGWNTDLSHQRKVKSYEVETAWYRHWSERCSQNPGCRVPELLAFDQSGSEVMIVLEDLDASGFPLRLTSLELHQIEACLRWLASFHASFMGEETGGLWEIGTYWHLGTRSEELEALEDEGLQAAAAAIDRKLNDAQYQTLVHGDAKLANFCFSADGERVAAVDFQYIGGGCGMKDVAYFIGSCLDEHSCEAMEAPLLNCYFAALAKALQAIQPSIDHRAVTAEWRLLYPVAWTDFHRFIKGWSPGHWKINGYSERLAQLVLGQLEEQE